MSKLKMGGELGIPGIIKLYFERETNSKKISKKITANISKVAKSTKLNQKKFKKIVDIFNDIIKLQHSQEVCTLKMFKNLYLILSERGIIDNENVKKLMPNIKELKEMDREADSMLKQALQK